MKFLIPQPLVTMAGQLWAVKNADAWNRNDPTVQTAARVFAYALTRMALAGAFFYALQRYKPDAKIASGVMALAVSAPATAMYWGGKCVIECVIDGLKMIKDHVATPAVSKDFVRSFFTKDVAVGAVTYVLGLVILNFHNIIGYKGFKGGVEWFMTKGMTPATMNRRDY